MSVKSAPEASIGSAHNAIYGYVNRAVTICDDPPCGPTAGSFHLDPKYTHDLWKFSERLRKILNQVCPENLPTASFTFSCSQHLNSDAFKDVSIDFFAKVSPSFQSLELVFKDGQMRTRSGDSSPIKDAEYLTRPEYTHYLVYKLVRNFITGKLSEDSRLREQERKKIEEAVKEILFKFYLKLFENDPSRMMYSPPMNNSSLKVTFGKDIPLDLIDEALKRHGVIKPTAKELESLVIWISPSCRIEKIEWFEDRTDLDGVDVWAHKISKELAKFPAFSKIGAYFLGYDILPPLLSEYVLAKVRLPLPVTLTFGKDIPLDKIEYFCNKWPLTCGAHKNFENFQIHIDKDGTVKVINPEGISSDKLRKEECKDCGSERTTYGRMYDRDGSSG